MQEIFVISQVPSLALDSTQPPLHWLADTFSPQGVKWLGCEGGHLPGLVLRMHLYPHTSHIQACTRTILLCKLELSDQKTTVGPEIVSILGQLSQEGDKG